MAACTTASWALVRARTAMLDQRRPGVCDCLARAAVQAASSASLAWADDGRHRAVDAAAGGGVDLPENGGVGLAVPSTAVATATTCGVQRWFSSRRMTLVPRRISGSRYSSDGSAPLNPYTDWLGSPTTKRSGSSERRAVSSRNWAGFTSCISSTKRWRVRQRTASAKAASPARASAQAVIRSSKSSSLRRARSAS